VLLFDVWSEVWCETTYSYLLKLQYHQCTHCFYFYKNVKIFYKQNLKLGIWFKDRLIRWTMNQFRYPLEGVNWSENKLSTYKLLAPKGWFEIEIQIKGCVWSAKNKWLDMTTLIILCLIFKTVFWNLTNWDQKMEQKQFLSPT
jgi:hypothetical protein